MHEAIISLIGNGPLLLMPRASVITHIVSQAETHIAVYNEAVSQTDTESEVTSSEKYGILYMHVQCLLWYFPFYIFIYLPDEIFYDYIISQLMLM